MERTMFSMSWDLLPWLLLEFGIPALFAFTLIFLPKRIVRWEGLFYRWYFKRVLHLTDNEIDKRSSPFQKFIMGTSFSLFVNRAPEHPEEFNRITNLMRVIGYFFCGFLIIVAFLLSCAIARGIPIVK